MICDGALVVNLVASIMMNGVCCLHSMSEEEEKKKDQREVLQKAIRVEWQRQRLLDEQFRQQKEKQLKAEQRRRDLMATKARALSKSNKHLQEEEEEDSCEGFVTRSLPPHRGSAIASPSMVMAQRRVRSAPAPVVHHRGPSAFTISTPRRESELSSLIDEDDDDGSLQDVELQ